MRQRLQRHVERLPIRLRLTIWYAVLLLAVLAIFGAALWIGLRIRLVGPFDDQLREQAALVAAAVRVQDGTLAIDASQLTAAQRAGSFIRLLTRDGRVVADTSPAVGGAPVDPRDVAAALAGATRFSSAEVGHRELRIVSLPVPNAGDARGVLQIGTPQGGIDEVMHELLVAILLATPAAALVALVGGYLLARRALAPVTAITGLASRISGGNDLHARLGLALPDDELGQLASTFDGMLSRIDAAFERQRRFTGDAAHELRTPLTLMRSRIDLARARPRSADEHLETLDGLDGDLARLSGVVGALLVLARSDSGQLTVNRERFDLGETITRIAAQYAETADAARIELRTEVAPAPMEGDEDLLVQLLVNLVDNALVHTPPGGVVTLGCRAEEAMAHLWVADTGVGIGPEHQTRVFDRFYRVDAGRARRTGGVGLGLSLCRNIVAAHGGEIVLDSVVGQGTRIDVRLPIQGPG